MTAPSGTPASVIGIKEAQQLCTGPIKLDAWVCALRARVRFRALPRVCECASGGCTYTWYTSADGESKYARFSSTLFCHAHALTSSVPFPAFLVPVPALSVPFPALLAWLHVPTCHAALAVAWLHVVCCMLTADRSVGCSRSVARRDSTAATGFC